VEALKGFCKDFCYGRKSFITFDPGVRMMASSTGRLMKTCANNFLLKKLEAVVLVRRRLVKCHWFEWHLIYQQRFIVVCVPMTTFKNDFCSTATCSNDICSLGLCYWLYVVCPGDIFSNDGRS